MKPHRTQISWIWNFFILHTVFAVVIVDDPSSQAAGIMFGQMFEDINHSGDGGLYGELLMNRAFQGSKADLSGHIAVDQKSSISLSSDRPLSKALSQALKLTSNEGGVAGFVNTGFNAFSTSNGSTFECSVYASFDRSQTRQRSSIQATLRDQDGRNIGSTNLTESVLRSALYPLQSNSFLRYTGTIESISSSDNCTLEITTNLSEQESAYFTLISLMRKNPSNNSAFDVRQDLYDALKHMRPSFMRFPGGNNLQGQTIDSRWKWNETIGPIIDRPGRDGTWGYHNTDGMGLLEWFTFVEEGLNVIPILGVYAGYSLNHDFVPIADLQPYIDDVMNQLEYIKGDATTIYGALRVSHGHPEPFALSHVEIGNEDWISDPGTKSYPGRFAAFAKAIREKYPNMTLISTIDNVEFPENSWIDEHFYPPPEGLINMFHRYDNRSGSAKVFIGEYSCRSYNGGILQWPNVIGAVAEAVFAIGAERNSDKVVGITYAPVLANVSPGSSNLVQWHPNLISFTQSKVILSTSYFVQKLLSKYRIDRLFSLQEATYGPLYYVVGMSRNKSVIIKIANPTNGEQRIEFSHDIADLHLEQAHGEGITGNATAANTDTSQPVAIQSMEISLSNGTIAIVMPAYSFAVFVAK